VTTDVLVSDIETVRMLLNRLAAMSEAIAEKYDEMEQLLALAAGILTAVQAIVSRIEAHS